MMPAEKRSLIILTTLFVILAGIAIYFLLFNQRNTPNTPFYTKNQETEQFERTHTRPSDPNLLDLGSPNQGNNFSLTRVLKGYLHEYNSSSGMLSLKNEFRNSPVLQVLEVSLGAIDKFYCWPESVSSNGTSVPTQSLTFHVEPDGRDIVMPGERQFSLDLLPDMLQEDQYLTIQLQDAFRNGRNNVVQKLIVLGC